MVVDEFYSRKTDVGRLYDRQTCRASAKERGQHDCEEPPVFSDWHRISSHDRWKGDAGLAQERHWRDSDWLAVDQHWRELDREFVGIVGDRQVDDED